MSKIVQIIFLVFFISATLQKVNFNKKFLNSNLSKKDGPRAGGGPGGILVKASGRGQSKYFAFEGFDGHRFCQFVRRNRGREEEEKMNGKNGEELNGERGKWGRRKIV